MNLCMSCSLANEIKSGNGKIYSFLNKGSVCALKAAPDLILIADF